MTSGWLARIPKIAIARELLCGEVGECSHVNVSILGHTPTFYLESFQCKQKCMLQGSNPPPKLSVLLSMCPGRRQPIFFLYHICMDTSKHTFLDSVQHAPNLFLFLV